jgi:hypothetical protein
VQPLPVRARSAYVERLDLPGDGAAVVSSSVAAPDLLRGGVRRRIDPDDPFQSGHDIEPTLLEVTPWTGV